MTQLVILKALTLEEIRARLSELVAKYAISEDDFENLSFYLAGIRAIEESPTPPEASL